MKNALECFKYIVFFFKLSIGCFYTHLLCKLFRFKTVFVYIAIFMYRNGKNAFSGMTKNSPVKGLNIYCTLATPE